VNGTVREFTRWLCRPLTGANPSPAIRYNIDPLTGANFSSEIGTALVKSGFSQVPVALRSAGSSCNVQSVG
jgi:hypothetical protein